MIRTIILFILTAILLSACIDQIDFDVNKNERLIVVDGLLTDKFETQKVNLSYSIDLNSQVNNALVGAEVYVEDDDGVQLQFMETNPGQYEALGQAIQGKKYRLIGNADGSQFQSNYQSVPDSFSIKSIYTTDTLVTSVNESGFNQNQKLLQFRAIAGEDSVAEELFLRFNTGSVYQVLETICSPFHTTKRCFFYNDQRPLNVNLVEIGATNAPVEFETLVYSRRISYKLAEVFAADVSLYSYNKEEFKYWQNLKSLFDQNGNITDVNPARLIGNMESDNEMLILGQFAVVGKSRMVKIVGNADFSSQVLPYCGLPGFRPWPLPTECCDCLAFENASLEKPDYWP